MQDEALGELSHGLTEWADVPWPNVWLGVTICNQAEADRDIPKLLEVPARVRFLSMEPLLGPVDLRFPTNLWGGDRCNHCCKGDRCNGRSHYERARCPFCRGTGQQKFLDWVIVRGESGASARQMHPHWARRLRDQCAAAGVPFLLKQWGVWVPRGPESLGYLIDERAGIARLRINTAGENDAFLNSVNGHTPTWLQMSGKKRAGRLLDGVQHDEFPGSAA